MANNQKSMAQQVADAQAAMASWSPEVRASVQLQGSSNLRPAPVQGELSDAEIEHVITEAKVHCVHPTADTTKDIARAIERHLRRDQESDAADAARWRALLGSARIRILGSAGINQDTTPDGESYNNYAHFGMEIWTKYGVSLNAEQTARMNEGNVMGRDVLTKYADIAILAQKKGGV